MLGSNLSLDISYPERIFVVLPPSKFRHSTCLQPRPIPSKSFLYHHSPIIQLSYRLTLYTLAPQNIALSLKYEWLSVLQWNVYIFWMLTYSLRICINLWSPCLFIVCAHKWQVHLSTRQQQIILSYPRREPWAMFKQETRKEGGEFSAPQNWDPSAKGVNHNRKSP